MAKCRPLVGQLYFKCSPNVCKVPDQSVQLWSLDNLPVPSNHCGRPGSGRQSARRGAHWASELRSNGRHRKLPRRGRFWAGSRGARAAGLLGLAELANFVNFLKFLQIFGGLVLGCIKTKFCKKICVRQHFSSSTRFASFCTAAFSKFSQKIGLKKQQFSWKFSKKICKCRKICKILSNFKNCS